MIKVMKFLVKIKQFNFLYFFKIIVLILFKKINFLHMEEENP